MKHSSTWDLLDLADDLIKFKVASTHARRNAAMFRIAQIDTELLSRVPEGEFITIYDYIHTEGDLAYFIEFLPVGFEPYIGEDNEYLTYLAIEKQAIQSTCWHQWEENYYGIRCTKCGAFVADGHGPWMPVDEGRL